jgi:hypothetical protein
MKVSRNQQGIAHVLVVVLLMAVVAAVAFAGYRVVKNNTDNNLSAGSGSVKSTAVPKTIKSKNDLSKADNALDNTTIDSSVDPNQLNSDLNAIQ